MANPQIEDGHLVIANEIVEALAKMNLNSSESRILWALFRKTYGWHKKEDSISLSQFASLTKISQHNVIRTIKQLEARKIIIVHRNGSVNQYQFQKNYDLWDTMLPITKKEETIVSNEIVSNMILSNQIVPNQIISKEILSKNNPDSVKPDSTLLSNQIDTKYTITKYTIQNIEYIQHIKIDEDFCNYFYSLKDKYKEIDYDGEFILFKEWWEKKTKKILKSPKIAWRNWIDNATKYKKRNMAGNNKLLTSEQIEQENNEILGIENGE